MKAIYTPYHRGGILLKKLKRWPSLRSKWSCLMVCIYSGKWNAWWRDGGSGYTTDPKNAGIFTFDQAEAASRHAGPEKRIEYVPLIEVKSLIRSQETHPEPKEKG